MTVEDIGEVMRAEDGTIVRDRVDSKRSWAFNLVLQNPTVANAWVDMILGRKSQVWSFDSSLYSSKGVAATLSGGGSPGQVATPFISGGSCSVTASSTVVVNDAFNYSASPTGWTAAFWWFNGTVWQHIVEDSTNAKYVNGVLVGARTFCTPGASSLTITNPDAATRNIDDLCVSTFWWGGATWPPSIFSYAKSLGPFPRLSVEGLLIENNFRRLNVIGEITGVDLAQGYLAGVWTANLSRVKVKLSEV